MKKGFEKGIDVVLVIVVGLIVAVAVVMLASSNIKKGEEAGTSTITQSEQTISLNLCKVKCETCKRVYGADCPAKWSTDADLKPCSDKGISCS